MSIDTAKADAEDLIHVSSGPLLPHTSLTRAIDGTINRIAIWSSVVWGALVAAIVLNVALRYGFSAGKVYIEELQWHFYAIGIAMGLSFAYVSDSHIRVDVISSRFRNRTTSWIEVWGTILMLLPYCVFVIYFSWAFVSRSFETGEVSMSPEGLPYRWMIKSFLPFSMFLLGAAALSRLIRSILFLRAHKSGQDGH